MFDLIIFDCDGVLVDSERISNAVFAEMLGELGLHFTLPEMFEIFVGRSMTACVEIIEHRLGHPLPTDFLPRLTQRTNEAYAAQLKPVTGIETVLNTLDVPFCVASSGTVEKMRTTLGVTGLLKYFENRLFSATQVAHGKPHPDIYLYAAQQMDADPVRCLVVEDSPVGVEAGTAAGMTVFGYAEIMEPRRLLAAGAVTTFHNMAQLPQLIAERGSACDHSVAVPGERNGQR
ncbi:MAG TPA: HAD family hydrolase [Burkholderiales bacterium]|nr:HAD family hydrolase [Burkholderiales bacterium]